MTSKPKTWARSFAISASVGLAAVASPLAAQSGDSKVFVDLGRWTIVEHTQARYCELRYNGSDARGLVFTKSSGAPGRLRLNAGRRNSYVQGLVTWEFDDNAVEGQMLGGQGFAPASDNSSIEQQFRQARALTIRNGGQTVARLSLKNSSAGLRLLNQCANQWWAGSAPPRATTPPPRIARRTTVATPTPSPRSQPQVQSQPQAQTQPQTQNAAVPLSGPFPPNRTLQALNPNDWVRANDFRRFSQARLGSGAVRFTLLVNEKGRVEECTINASSGSRDFDATACRTVQKRARFEPATDASGNARSARYTSTVRLATGG